MKKIDEFNSWWRDEGAYINPIASLSALEREKLKPIIEATFLNVYDKYEQELERLETIIEKCNKI